MQQAGYQRSEKRYQYKQKANGKIGNKNYNFS